MNKIDNLEKYISNTNELIKTVVSPNVLDKERVKLPYTDKSNSLIVSGLNPTNSINNMNSKASSLMHTNAGFKKPNTAVYLRNLAHRVNTRNNDLPQENSKVDVKALKQSLILKSSSPQSRMHLPISKARIVFTSEAKTNSRSMNRYKPDLRMTQKGRKVSNPDL